MRCAFCIAEERAFDPRIRNVMASIGTEEKIVLIANSAGDLVADFQPLLRVNVTCIAEDGGKRQQGSAGGGLLISRERKISGMDAQRNHRQLGQHHPRDTQTGLQIVHLGLKQAGDVVFDGGGGANHRVPGLHRGRQQSRQRVHGASRRGGSPY